MAEIKIGSQSFKTKQAAAREIRRILHGAELNTDLIDAEANLIAALYARHPRPRLNQVPKGFHVAINNFHGSLSRGFHAIFADGSFDAFSYRPCLTPEVATPSVLQVMRAAIIASQREVLRSVYWRIRPSLAKCWRCKDFVPIEAAHVHHLHPKFIDIADHFISLIGFPRIEKGKIGAVFVDNVMLNRWQRFHESVAQRVVTCAKCNAEAERDDYSEQDNNAEA